MESVIYDEEVGERARAGECENEGKAFSGTARQGNKKATKLEGREFGRRVTARARDQHSMAEASEKRQMLFRGYSDVRPSQRSPR